MNYRKLNTKESQEILNASSVLHHADIMAKYELPLYQRRYYDEGNLCFEFYLADCKKISLAEKLGYSKTFIADEGNFNYFLSKIN